MLSDPRAGSRGWMVLGLATVPRFNGEPVEARGRPLLPSEGAAPRSAALASGRERPYKYGMTTRSVAGIFVGVCAGAAVGIGAYTFVYAKGASYMTDDPAACSNCHAMQAYYDAWLKSSHHGAAVCNDCHTPEGILAKYATKARNGFWHSFAFTTGRFPEPIQITKTNQGILETACRKCHWDIVEAIASGERPAETLSCVRCHGSVGHMR